jgi:hypothetical protein
MGATGIEEVGGGGGGGEEEYSDTNLIQYK